MRIRQQLSVLLLLLLLLAALLALADAAMSGAHDLPIWTPSTDAAAAVPRNAAVAAVAAAAIAAAVEVCLLLPFLFCVV